MKTLFKKYSMLFYALLFLAVMAFAMIGESLIENLIK